MMVTRDLRGGGMRVYCLMGFRISVAGDEKVLEVDGKDGCTTM